MTDPENDLSVSGAVYRPLHVERCVKIYPIQESELRTIGVFNGMFAFWCSIGSGAIMLIISCIWDCVVAQAWPSGTAWAFIALCVLASIGSFAVAGYNLKSRNDELSRILNETKGTQVSRRE